MAKATKKEMYQRELEIQELMAEGKTRDQICEICAERWKVAPRTVETQYYKLVTEMEKLVIESREELRATLMTRNDYIYQRSMKTGKHKTALDANMANAKIGGLFNEKAEMQKESKKIIITEREQPSLQVVKSKVENE